MYTLIIVWNTGEKEEHIYNTREQAEQAAAGYKKAFGAQVWTGVR